MRTSRSFNSVSKESEDTERRVLLSAYTLTFLVIERSIIPLVYQRAINAFKQEVTTVKLHSFSYSAIANAYVTCKRLDVNYRLGLRL